MNTRRSAGSLNEPLQVRTVVDALVDALRERILSEQIPGGTEVTENAVARDFAVARPTAKTAIERLVAEGLLSRDSYRSAYVPNLTAADVRDLYFARSAVEESAIRRVANKGVVPPSAWAADRRLRQAIADEQLTAFIDADIEFHRALIDSLGSRRLSRAHSSILTETRLCMAQVQVHLLLRPAEIAGEHKAILDAIADQDPAHSADAVASHLLRASNALTGHLEASTAEQNTNV